jgi:hypothetical protein
MKISIFWDRTLGSPFECNRWDSTNWTVLYRRRHLFVKILCHSIFISTALHKKYVIWSMSIRTTGTLTRRISWQLIIPFGDHKSKAGISYKPGIGKQYGGIAKCYGLEAVQDLSLLHVVQTGSGAHPAPCSMGTGGKEIDAWSWQLTSI